MMLNDRLNRMVFAPDGSAGATPSAAPAPVPSASPAAAAPASSPAAPPPVAFAETLPENIRGEAAFRDIKSLDALAISYLNAQKMLGVPPANLLKLPTAPDDAAWSDVWARLGRPDAPDKYELQAPEGVSLNAEMTAAFKSQAHALGLNTQQAAKLFEWYGGQTSAVQAAAAQTREAAYSSTQAALKTEWGAAYDQNLDLATRALNHFGGPELGAYLRDSGLGNNPVLIRAFAKMGTSLTEDGVLGRATAGSLTPSPAEATQQKNAMLADKNFVAVYMNKHAPGHADAVAKIQALYQLGARA